MLNFKDYRPSISDQVKVGFFSCDRFAQTEESDILALNDAINNLIYLNKVHRIIIISYVTIYLYLFFINLRK